jgi:Xaa-Pro aminopeptidase
MTIARNEQAAPFDTGLLDRLMEAGGIDLLLVTSKHNVQYLLGGHRAFFFEGMDAIGVSRYLPVLIYPRSAPARAGYIGHRLEGNQIEVSPVWTPHTETRSEGSVDAIEKAAAFVRQQGLAAGRIGVETAFLPLDAAQALERLLPGSALVNSLDVLERLRARKGTGELDQLRQATERVADAMGAALAACRPGMTKRELVDVLRRAEAERDLVFEYCLVTAGTGLNRAPSDQVIQPGDIISLDSGGNYHGYIGDICRMGILGEPDAELVGLLAGIEAIQRAAFGAIRPGALGGALYERPLEMIAASPLRDHMHFVAHGVGLVTHEVPHLTSRGPVRYADADAHRPLEPGLVLSVETTLRHPSRGFIKLEDTVAVTETGSEVFGDVLRGWNRAGQPAPATRAA